MVSYVVYVREAKDAFVRLTRPSPLHEKVFGDPKDAEFNPCGYLATRVEADSVLDDVALDLALDVVHLESLVC